MAETVVGGAYQGIDGSWHDAEGKLLNKTQIRDAERVLADHQVELAEAERLRILSETAQNPIAMALASVLKPEAKTEPKPVKPVEPPPV